MGHKALEDLLKTPVLVEEKLDGSQFSFGVYINQEGERLLKCRSKGADINMISPEGLFKRAVEAIREIEPLLKPGYTYRSEYLAKPKHNTLCYDRIPKNYLMIFDIDAGLQCYLPAQEKKEEAARLGLESIPVFFSGIIENLEMFRELLNHESCLGGQKIEGVVIKNYRLFAPDKKVLMGKFVSEAFKESHSKEWKVSNPSQGDIVQLKIDALRTIISARKEEVKNFRG